LLAQFFILQNRYQRHFVLAGFIFVITNIWHLYAGGKARMFRELFLYKITFFFWSGDGRKEREKNTKFYALVTQKGATRWVELTTRPASITFRAAAETNFVAYRSRNSI
jgi:hypothetical protein